MEEIFFLIFSFVIDRGLLTVLSVDCYLLSVFPFLYLFTSAGFSYIFRSPVSMPGYVGLSYGRSVYRSCP